MIKKDDEEFKYVKTHLLIKLFVYQLQQVERYERAYLLAIDKDDNIIELKDMIICMSIESKKNN